MCEITLGHARCRQPGQDRRISTDDQGSRIMPLSPPDAILLQRLLNVTLDRVPPLRTDGGIGERSRAAHP